jgi:5'/3'-nucleotidase
MGVRFLLREEPPNLVMSGVNRGQNLADDVIYSGTVAGAIEELYSGFPQLPNWKTELGNADESGCRTCAQVIKVGWPEGVVLNVNFPDCEPDAVKGSAATAQGQRDPDLLRIEDRLDTRGRGYYWRHQAATRQATRRY